MMRARCHAAARRLGRISRIHWFRITLLCLRACSDDERRRQYNSLHR
jgi:hypothetical protein